MKIANNILELIGNTPLVRIQKLNADGYADVIVKLESFNPLSSVKDRVGIAMIEKAEREGKLKPGGTIVEATSGNTGIGLAFATAVKGYKLILTMPETMSIERRKLLYALGATVELCDASEGMNASVKRANEIISENPDAFMPDQFSNEANREIHRTTTAEEIWKDTDGNLDIFVSGVGSGGTVSGIGSFLKEKNPGIKVIAVEPSKSSVLSGGIAAAHKIQGIGAGFIPSIYDASVVDEVITVTEEDAGFITRILAREEGIFTGVSSGAALFAALELSKDEKNKGKRIVVILPDSGDRYLSTWLYDYIDAEKVGMSVTKNTAFSLRPVNPQNEHAIIEPKIFETDSIPVKNAVMNFRKGLYCSEAIIRAFNEYYQLGMTDNELKIATGFGAGLGGSKCSCGSVTAGVIILSRMTGRTQTSESEEITFQLVGKLHDQFKKKYKAMCCRVLTRKVLWGSVWHKNYCERIVWDAACILDSLISSYLQKQKGGKKFE
ncbi:MAG: cysteine synthase A [Spirochaetaceae bacterium]|jgi:cysteine synthase A|nr:cysteine synthase A [Spirochaetaceae bacterium]